MSISAADLLDSLAQRLDDLGLATWSPTGAYPRDGVLPVVTLGKMPQGIVSAVSLNCYFTDPDVETVEDNPLHLVQLESRGPTLRSVLDFETALIRDLHTTTSGTWPGGVSPDTVTFSSAAPAEPDDDGSWTKAANFAIRLNP